MVAPDPESVIFLPDFKSRLERPKQVRSSGIVQRASLVNAAVSIDLLQEDIMSFPSYLDLTNLKSSFPRNSPRQKSPGLRPSFSSGSRCRPMSSMAAR